jgi:2-keto-3-deoxy-L-rhamnonate aldolase RhmA
MVVIVMIETAAGVEAADAIAGTPGIDGVIIGPYDLSGSLGVIGQLDHAVVRAAVGRVSAAAARAGISSGAHIVHFSEEAFAAARAIGHTFLALGVDMIFLGDAVAGALRAARRQLDARPTA